MFNEKQRLNPEIEPGLVINRNGLISDSHNQWLGREWGSAVKSGEADAQLINFLHTPILTYEEYLGGYELRYPGITQKTLANPLSNKSSIERYNQLVAQYNELSKYLEKNIDQILLLVEEGQNLTKA